MAGKHALDAFDGEVSMVHFQRGREARANIVRPPSTYLKRYYYDCLTHSEPSLRMLIDSGGIYRVWFGADWPVDMALAWPASRVLSLASLTQEEKEAMVGKDLEKMLGLQSSNGGSLSCRNPVVFAGFGSTAGSGPVRS